MDLSKVVAAYIIAQRVERDAAFKGLATFWTLEVSGDTAWEGLQLVDLGMHVQVRDALVWFTGTHETKWVSSGDVEGSDAKHAAVIGRKLGFDRRRLARLKARHFYRQKVIAELFEGHATRGSSAASVKNGQV